MKLFLIGLLSGSTAVCGSVVLAGGSLAHVFVLGFLTSFFLVAFLCRVIGFGRVARLFQLLETWTASDQRALIDHPSKRRGANGIADSDDPAKRYAGVDGSVRSCMTSKRAPRFGASVNEVQRACSSIPLWSDAGSAPAHQRQSSARERRQPQTVLGRLGERQQQKHRQRSISVRNSISMLRPVQQELVSALVNLGMQMKQAERVVVEVTRDHEGQSFDELFRLCLPPKQERRAAA